MGRIVRSKLHHTLFSCLLCIGSLLAGVAYCQADEIPQIKQGTFKFMRPPSGTQDCIPDINKANILFSMGKYKNGIDLLLKHEKKECDLNSSDGNIFYNLGIIYEEGFYCEKNIKKAIQFYEQAAKQENIEAIYTLGYFYEYTENPPNYKQAAKWFKVGADLGDPECSASLGTFYFDRKYKMVNIKKAYELFNFAAQYENVIALYCLGEMYYAGLGVKKNYDTATQYFTRSANQGVAEAASYLSWIYLFNLKKTQPEKSLFWIKIALKLGYDDKDEVALVMNVLNEKLPEDVIKKVQQEADEYYRTNLADFDIMQ